MWQRLEGRGADGGQHFPPGHLFSAIRGASRRLRACAGARMSCGVGRWGEARGAPLREVGRAAPVAGSAAGPRGQARRGSGLAPRDWLPLGGGIAGPSPSVFAPGWGAPRRSRKLHPRPQLPSPLASLAAGLQAGNELFFFDFKKGNPCSPPPPPPAFLVLTCVCLWGGGGGRADEPAPGRASVLIGRGVSWQTGASGSLSFPFHRLGM